MNNNTNLDPIHIFPIEVSEKIFSFLNRETLKVCLLINKEWNQVANMPLFWKDLREFYTIPDDVNVLTYLSKNVVKSPDEMLKKIANFVNRCEVNTYNKFTCSMLRNNHSFTIVIASGNKVDDKLLPKEPIDTIEICIFDKKREVKIKPSLIKETPYFLDHFMGGSFKNMSPWTRWVWPDSVHVKSYCKIEGTYPELESSKEFEEELGKIENLCATKIKHLDDIQTKHFDKIFYNRCFYISITAIGVIGAAIGNYLLKKNNLY